MSDDSPAEEMVSAIRGATLEKARRVGPLLAAVYCTVLCVCVQELCEVPEERLERIGELRMMIEEVERLPEFEKVSFSRKDNRFLLRFLRARKFNPERALQLYLNYHKYRHKHSELLGQMDPSSVKHVLKTEFFALLDHPSRCGSRTVVVFPSRCASM